MCGIAGIWNFDGKPIAEEAIIRFTDTLKHRGPDGRGIWQHDDKHIAFGHRRLAIIDLSHEADQPMSYAEDRYHMVFNGEIFNFIEIRDELKLKGYTFKTDSDTEVILAAYHEWRERMLNKFNGMWAIVIYDQEEQRCFIARDRFGIKPLNYRLTSYQFAFSSELKSFRSLEGFKPAMDKESAACFLRTGFGVEGTDRTMLDGIKKLRAGHFGYISKDKVIIKRWWQTADHLVEVPEDIAKQAEAFRELFYDSVKLRMRSDVPIGTSLSGGFDSSAVVCALAEIGNQHKDVRQSKEWQQTFVATFPGKSNDERPQAEEVIQYSGVKGHFFEVKEDEALKEMHQVLMDFDDVYVGIPVAPWLIYRELRRNKIVVSLDGHGADELMGAYMPAAGAYLAGAPSWLGNVQYNQTLMQELHQLPGVHAGLKEDLMLNLQYHPDFAGVRNSFQTFKSWKDRFSRVASTGLLSEEAMRADQTDFMIYDNADLPPMDETTRTLYRMFHRDVLPTILRNFDRVSMAHGIEIRMPFMDWRLVRYVFSLPGASKISGGYTKRVARDAMKGRMPEHIRASKVKVGFNSPMPEWFAGPLKPWIKDMISAHDNELVDMKKLRESISSIESNGNWNWSNAGNTWKCLHYLWFEKNFLKTEL